MSARVLIVVLVALAPLLAGCAASQSQPRLAVAPPPATSHPAAEASAFDVQQLSGQIVAGVQAKLTSSIETTVENTLRAEVQATGVGGDVAGYRSEFGVGATLVVALALLLALVLSHRREMLRIKQNGKHGPAHPCGKLQT
ncbi:MAG: hypothetical protein KA383_12790 [Phycisphaerae bacterium]|nr:hypothetical protein [Phycisphaerae bacterium]